MHSDEVVSRYLAALGAADSDGVLELFAPDAEVNSPLYGTLPATEFFPALFADTAESRLTLRTTMSGELRGQQVISFWFDFDWTLANGEPAPFTVVDVAELAADGRIARLTIIYDTAPLRDAFNRQQASARQES